jgi:hypothetical protein
LQISHENPEKNNRGGFMGKFDDGLKKGGKGRGSDRRKSERISLEIIKKQTQGEHFRAPQYRNTPQKIHRDDTYKKRD